MNYASTMVSFFLVAIFVVKGSIRPLSPPNTFEGLKRVRI